MSMLGNYGVASATVIADQPCELFAVEPQFIYKLFESEPQLATRFYMKLAQNLAKILINVSASYKAPSPRPQEPSDESKDQTNEDAIVSHHFGLPVDEIVIKSKLKYFLQKPIN